MKRAASAHVYAQKLNNIAASCIEIGQYDRAISSLGKALRLSEMHIPDQLFDRSQVCTCFNCSLDGCIRHTENNPDFNVSVKLIDQNNNKSNDNDNVALMKNMMHVDSHSIIYRRAIRVPPKSIQEEHNMGSTLFLIITFNLAMAHHLKTVSIINKNASSHSRSDTTRLIHHTIQFYLLANDWQNRYKCYYNNSCCEKEGDNENDDDPIMTVEIEGEETEGTTTTSTSSNNNNPIISVRFNMILCNNLSHLHRLMNNNTMSQRCLEHLLSIVMLVIDQNNTNINIINNNNNGNGNINAMNNDTTAINTSGDEIEFEYYDDDEEEEDQQQSTSFIDVQDFVQATSSLILKNQCSEAA